MLQVTVREHHGDKLWWDGGVEFLIDAQRHGTKEYLPDDFCHHINILNAVYEARCTVSGKSDYKWTGPAQHAVKVFDDYHYLGEVAVPWKEIGVDAVAGQTSIGIDFCTNGTDAETGEYSYFDWCHLKVFHDPPRFGELVLQGPGST
jgi:Carbohydrate family 9 binding domain-like